MNPLFFDLDLQTAFRFAGLVWVILAIPVWSIGRGLARPSLRLWVAGSVTLGFGLMLLSVRPLVPTLVGFHLAQTALSVGISFLVLSILGELNPSGFPSRNSVRRLGIPLGIYLIGFYAQVSLNTNVSFRLAYVALGQASLATVYVLSVWLLHRKHRSSGSSILLGTGLLFLTIIFARITGALTGFEDEGTYVASSEQLIVFYAGLLASILSPIGIGLFQADRILFAAASLGSATALQPRGGQFKTMQQLVDERNDLLVSIERSARLNAVGMYSAAMAHELRQPLTVIGLDAGYLERQLRKEGIRTPSILEAIENLRGEQMRAAAILSALRELYLEGPETRVDLDLAETVGHTVGMVRTLPEARGIEIHESGLETRIALSAHPIQLQQVVFNLLTNALRASTQARGTRVHVSVLSENGFGVIEIRDSGPGLPPMFLSVTQAVLPPPDSGGMGLGLTIARTITERHFGVIEGETLPEGGALLRVRIPLDPGTSPNRASAD